MSIMKYLKSILIIITTMIICCLIITTLSYFDIISLNTTKHLKMFSMIISMIIGSIYLGMHSTNKRYKKKKKIGILEIIILLVINTLVFKNKICFENIIYYLIILISAILGSIIGINKKLKS